MRLLFTFLAFLVVPVLVFSQNTILFKDHDGNVMNGQTITVQGDISLMFNSAIVDFLVQNNTSNNLTIKARKEVLSFVPSTYNDFCWNGTCYPDNTTVSPGAYSLAAGATTPVSHQFTAHYHCQGIAGTTSVKYYLFVEGTAIESWIIINFIVNNTSVPGEQLSNNLVYPNPATDLFYVDGSQLKSAKIRVEVYNMIGRKVNEFQFGQAEKQTIDCSAWDKGVYILRIYSDGNLVKSTKITKK